MIWEVKQWPGIQSRTSAQHLSHFRSFALSPADVYQTRNWARRSMPLSQAHPYIIRPASLSDSQGTDREVHIRGDWLASVSAPGLLAATQHDGGPTKKPPVCLLLEYPCPFARLADKHHVQSKLVWTLVSEVSFLASKNIFNKTATSVHINCSLIIRV